MDNEKKRLYKIKHLKNVSHIIGYQDNSLFLNKIQGQDLYYYLSSLNEYDVQNIAYKLLNIVKNLHNINIVHGDIKIENIMYDTNSGDITLIDFEQGRHTKHYISPELLINYDKYKNSKSIDIWSIGVTIYVLLTRKYPYKNYKHIISHKKYNLISDKTLSKHSINFIDNLLVFDHLKRPDINTCIKHIWFNKFNTIKDSNNINIHSKSFITYKPFCCCIL